VAQGRLPHLVERHAHTVTTDGRETLRASSSGASPSPERMDMTDVYARMAKDEGVLVAISTDAHRAADLGPMRFGVGQARRGWLSAKDVLNTRSLPELRRLLRRARAKA